MYKDLLTFPFKSGPIVANLSFAVLFAMSYKGMQIAGIFGLAVIPAIIILIMLYGHYSIDIVLAAGKGIAERTVLQFAGFRPQILFFFLTQIALYVFLLTYLGILITAITVSLVLPASIAAMAIEKNFLHALNPYVLLSYLKLYRSSILITIGGIWLYIVFLLWLPESLWLLIKLFILLSVQLWIFYTVGILIVRPIIQNDEDPLSKPVKAFVENEAPPEVSFTRLTDEWHRFNEVREITKALNSIGKYIRTQINQQQAAEKVMLELTGWRNTRLAYRFLPNYLQVMAGTKKFGLMYKHYRKLCLEHEAMAITDPAIRQSFLQFANAMNDQEIIEKLSE